MKLVNLYLLLYNFLYSISVKYLLVNKQTVLMFVCLSVFRVQRLQAGVFPSILQERPVQGECFWSESMGTSEPGEVAAEGFCLFSAAVGRLLLIRENPDRSEPRLRLFLYFNSVFSMLTLTPCLNFVSVSAGLQVKSEYSTFTPAARH